MNKWSLNKVPFFFLIDFEMEKIRVHRLDNLPQQVHFEFSEKNNILDNRALYQDFHFSKIRFPFSSYQSGFERVKRELLYGNSFLLNLSYPTPIITNLSFEQIYKYSHAKYKLWIENECVVFSPEPFVKIKENKIYSFPMKGTIDASVKDAEKIILENKKELAEHYTIVDLIRNDLSKVAKKVHVEKFRFVEKVQSPYKELLQVSSQIAGEIKETFKNKIGDIIFELLPAGSISGAPKNKTLEIIKTVEGQKRGYYTGIMGIFDGKDLDSGVMIRFIEKRQEQLFFRSGGGITHMSNLEEEYQELLDKVYVPIIRDHKNRKWNSPKSPLSPSPIPKSTAAGA